MINNHNQFTLQQDICDKKIFFKTLTALID